MIKTYKQLVEIDQVVGALYAKDKTLEGTKFGYAYKKFCEKNYLPAVKELQEKLEELRIDNCLEDPKTKEILRDDTGKYKFSKDGLKKLILEQKKATDEFNSKEFECTPYISSYVPELTDEERELLNGLLI